ncbi:hypothetical protein GF325_12220 [Candidatus Bathyarchaeota archaeon]|nr:hypothetical protein [Candidatus Bathyarchaeota archaeon]
MSDNENEKSDLWKDFIRDYWKFALIGVAGIVAAFIAGVFVFLWRVDVAPAVLGTPPFIGDWSVKLCILFFLNVLLWEFLIVGIPFISGLGAVFGLWWYRLSQEEKEKYDLKDKKHKRKPTVKDGGGVVPFVMAIFWFVIVAYNGYWDTPFSSWEFTIFVSFMIRALIWFLIIFGPPALVALIWWLRRELSREESAVGIPAEDSPGNEAGNIEAVEPEED